MPFEKMNCTKIYEEDLKNSSETDLLNAKIREMNYEIRRTLLEARNEKGLRQEDIATAIGFKDKKNLYRLEKGINPFTIEKLIKYADTVGLKVSISFEQK